MNRIRIGLALTTIIGVIYGATSLFTSLTHFALGVIISALAVIGFGLCDTIEQRWRHEHRENVWARRELEAQNNLPDPVKVLPRRLPHE